MPASRSRSRSRSAIKTVGSKREVYLGKAKRTSGRLVKKDIVRMSDGETPSGKKRYRYVSKKMRENGKKAMARMKARYHTLLLRDLPVFSVSREMGFYSREIGFEISREPGAFLEKCSRRFWGSQRRIGGPPCPPRGRRILAAQVLK